jgi:hypothetical protein
VLIVELEISEFREGLEVMGFMVQEEEVEVVVQIRHQVVPVEEEETDL